MAVPDINDGYKSISNKITTNKKYKKLKEDVDQLKKKKGETFEKAKGKVSTTLSDASKLKKKYQKNLKTQLDNLLELKFLSSASGNSTKQYLKKTFIKAIKELQPKIIELLTQEVVKAVGCSQDQTYNQQTFYIRVKAIDLTNLLKDDPTSDTGKLLYEPNNIQFFNYPFSMNRELYDLIQNINVPFSTTAGSSYKGISGQELFDITYVESYFDPVLGQTIQGNFYKIDLKNRTNSVNKITEFLKDYYGTIKFLDFKNFFANLMNLLCGAISIKRGDGKLDLAGLQKVLLIIQRILGLCFDKTKEIDVTGGAKLSEGDSIDESFFEFTEIDLRIIDQTVSDIKLGLVEFEECDTVKLPVNTDDILVAINNLNFVGDNNNNAIDDASNLTDALTKNPGWFPLEINIDLSFLKEFPKALLVTILSPKVLLPLFIALKSLGDDIDNKINSFLDFMKNFKTFIIDLTSKISALFIKILVDIIKKDIKNLISSIIGDITNEKLRLRLEVIRALVEVVTTILNLVKDFRECKSVIDELLSLLKLAGKGFGNKIPYPLLLSSELLDGYSSTRAFLNVIEEFEKLGLPTGPMPDGSPNLMLASIKATMDGMDKEEAQNGNYQIAIKPTAVLPINLTQGLTVYGKKGT
jgi:F0F1-type ATP synthase membrane subunit b/b'